MSLLRVRMLNRRLADMLKNSLVVVLLVFLAACDSIEERVAEHYERGLVLLEEGTPQKAILEFNNALQLDENHAPSHFAIGEILEARGEFQQAFARYVKTTEIDPNHAEARLKLARFFLLSNNMEEAKEELNLALKLEPGNPDVHTLEASIAMRTGDMKTAKAALDRASGLAPSSPEVALLDISYLQQTTNLATALARADEALTLHGGHLPLYLIKLRLLEEAGDQPAIGAHLAKMIAAFPDEARLRQTRAQWALQNEDTETAETELRAIVAATPGDRDAIVTLIRFLRSQRGEESARAELVSQIDQVDEPFELEMMLAQFDLEAGKTEAAITYLRDLAGRADRDANQARIVLARLLLGKGEVNEAYALVDAALAEDPNDTEAQVLQIVRLIEAEKHDEAIQVVRNALGEAPDDSRLLMLAARAQELSGNINLASDRLAKAVRVSSYAPNIVDRYVDFLLRSNRRNAAETILTEAIKRHSDNARLFDLLASVQLQLGNWAGADAAINRLQELDSDRARQLRAASLISQEQFDEGAELLRNLPEDARRRAASMVALVETYVQEGRADDAKAFLDEVLEKDPENTQALGLKGNLFAAEDDFASAEDLYKKILAIDAENIGAHSALARLRQAAGDPEGAEAALLAGLEASPDNVNLTIRLAQRRELEGAVEEAIELYDRAYRQAPDILLVVNNLASLLSDKRAGAAQDIELAYKIAGRLRNADLPHYRDTYGWTRFLKNEHKEALEYLQPAADALPNNPWVRYHLGMTYAALKKSSEARLHLEAALAQSEGIDFPQAEEIREALAGLE